MMVAVIFKLSTKVHLDYEPTTCILQSTNFHLK